MNRASDFFREMVGDRALLMNPAARALYETLRGFEDHHHEKHQDCEDKLVSDVRLAMAAMYEKPSALPSGSPDAMTDVSER